MESVLFERCVCVLSCFDFSINPFAEDNETGQTDLSQFVTQGRPCQLLYPVEDRAKINQTICPNAVELGC